LEVRHVGYGRTRGKRREAATVRGDGLRQPGWKKDGGMPRANLMTDGAGKLYGTTIAGGGAGCSGIGCEVDFEVTP
jgi:hypothetical protein